MSPMILRQRVVMAADGVWDVGFSGDSLNAMGDATSVVPSPMSTDETIAGLMFADAFDEGVTVLEPRCGVFGQLLDKVLYLLDNGFSEMW